MKKTTLTDKEFAKVALYLDDPYGDGIRLEIVREPSAHRIAAQDFVYKGQTDIFDAYKVYVERGKEFCSDPKNVRFVKKHVLN